MYVKRSHYVPENYVRSRLTFSGDFAGDFEPLKKGQNPPPLGLVGFGALEGDLPGEPREFHT